MNFPCDRLNVTSHSADAILAKVDPGQTRSLPSRTVIGMDNEILITAAFLGAGLPACMIIPGMLVIWNRVLNHMEWEKTKLLTNGTGGTNPLPAFMAGHP